MGTRVQPAIAHVSEGAHRDWEDWDSEEEAGPAEPMLSPRIGDGIEADAGFVNEDWDSESTGEPAE